MCIVNDRLYLARLFNGPMSKRKRDAIKELVSAAIEVNSYFTAHPEVFRRSPSRIYGMAVSPVDEVYDRDGGTPYESLWRLKDAVAELRGA